MNEIKEHFDFIAPEYDEWKRRNSYYYFHLKKLYRELIGQKKTILDFGCGTGGILADLEPAQGVGIDISPEMTKLAKIKYSNQPNLYFTNLREDPRLRSIHFDFIISADVVEHLEDVLGSFRYIRSLCDKNTTLIVSMANPAWEPLLVILEKFKLKMPEGPHTRISFKELRDILKQADFKVVGSGGRLLLPSRIIPMADYINERFYRSRFLEKFGLIGYLIVRPAT